MIPENGTREVFPVYLGGDFSALIDHADLPLIEGQTWDPLRRGNGKIYARSRQQPHVLMHRVILGAADGDVVDHVNGNGLDNRRCNIRICSSGQNSQNSKAHRDSLSGFKGITWDKWKQGWKARISCDKRTVVLGLFPTAAEAAHAYDEAARRLHGEFARLNFPLPGEQSAVRS